MSEENQDGSVATPAPEEKPEGQAGDVVEESSPEGEGKTAEPKEELDAEGNVVPKPEVAPEPKGKAETLLQEMAKKFGWTEENAAEEAAKMAMGLEGKLGNWKETEEAAAAYKKFEPILQNPKVLEALGMAQKQEEFIEADHSPQEIIDHRAKQIVESVLKEKGIDPMMNDFYGDKAKRAISNVRAKYPDFDNYKDEINTRLEKTPWLIGDENTLEDLYKVLNYDKVQNAGEKVAIDKLKGKKDLSLGEGGVNPKTQSKGKMSVRESLEAAWGK